MTKGALFFPMLMNYCKNLLQMQMNFLNLQRTQTVNLRMSFLRHIKNFQKTKEQKHLSKNEMPIQFGQELQQKKSIMRLLMNLGRGMPRTQCKIPNLLMSIIERQRRSSLPCIPPFQKNEQIQKKRCLTLKNRWKTHIRMLKMRTKTPLLKAMT